VTLVRRAGALVAAGLVLLLVPLLLSQPLSILAEPDPVAGKHICLDAGHGGSDPGAVTAVNGVVLEEADINLDIALYLAGAWTLRGANVTLTRGGDETKSANDRYTACNEAGADMLVSVHTNSVSTPTIDGTLAIYFHNDDKVLAQRLHDAMWERLRSTAPDPSAFTDFGLKKDALGIVLKSNMPAAVAEPVFMSHPGEAERLLATIAECGDANDNLCRRTQIAAAIAAGVDAYFAGGGGGGGAGPGCPPGKQRQGAC
jgi:N-acetylmuramoyl-L-alanine amidase